MSVTTDKTSLPPEEAQVIFEDGLFLAFLSGPDAKFEAQNLIVKRKRVQKKRGKREHVYVVQEYRRYDP